MYVSLSTPSNTNSKLWNKEKWSWVYTHTKSQCNHCIGQTGQVSFSWHPPYHFTEVASNE